MKQHKHSPLHLRQTTLSGYKPFDMIVFSHLRWEFVFQRPQHLITRLARKWNVLFVEEATPRGNLYQAKKNITVFQPKSNGKGLTQEITHFLNSIPSGIQPKIVWFYSPAYVDILKQIKPSAIVYDCMDELSAFKGASPELKTQELTLMQHADIVFTGGKSLYESKRQMHANVYCYPSSVDKNHFKKALSVTTRIPADFEHIPKPIAIYYGVLDERLDTSLLKATAQSKPEVSFVLIGPMAKIDTKDLPQRSNIFYIGQRTYQDLPAYLKGADIALIPFAMNESTKYISPTKTLEYMAAGLPIISTPIYDVVRDYEHTVTIATDAKHIVLAIDNFLNETPLEKNLRLAQYQTILNNTSWDKTAHAMIEHLNSILFATASKSNYSQHWV